MRALIVRVSVACLAVYLPAPLRAQQLPPPVVAGLAELKKGDPSKAIDAWTNTWPEGLARDSSRLRLNNSFGNVAETGNVPSGWELVRDQQIGAMIHRFYFVVFCAHDPRYLVLSAYQRPDSSWTVDQIQIVHSLTSLPGLDEAAFLTAFPPKH